MVACLNPKPPGVQIGIIVTIRAKLGLGEKLKGRIEINRLKKEKRKMCEAADHIRSGGTFCDKLWGADRDLPANETNG